MIKAQGKTDEVIVLSRDDNGLCDETWADAKAKGLMILSRDVANDKGKRQNGSWDDLEPRRGIRLRQRLNGPCDDLEPGRGI